MVWGAGGGTSGGVEGDGVFLPAAADGAFTVCKRVGLSGGGIAADAAHAPVAVPVGQPRLFVIAVRPQRAVCRAADCTLGLLQAGGGAAAVGGHVFLRSAGARVPVAGPVGYPHCRVVAVSMCRFRHSEVECHLRAGAVAAGNGEDRIMHAHAEACVRPDAELRRTIRGKRGGAVGKARAYRNGVIRAGGQRNRHSLVARVGNGHGLGGRGL